jgi:hypothetical protein
MVVCAYNSRTREGKAGGLLVWGHPGLHSETPFKNTQKERRKCGVHTQWNLFSQMKEWKTAIYGIMNENEGLMFYEVSQKHKYNVIPLICEL